MILLLDFTYNLEKGSSDWDDYYSRPLNEQWENSQRRFNIRTDLQTFIEETFSSYTSEYYLSLPNLLRETKEDNRGNIKYTNVVVRAKYTSELSVFLIGDVKVSNIMALNVKGIEFIDNGAIGQGEKTISCECLCAFTKKILPNGTPVADFGVDWLKNQPLLITQEYMEQLWNSDIGDFSIAAKEYQKWDDYIKFRNYYLQTQGQKGIAFDGVEVLDTYSINSRDYILNKEIYEPYVLGEEFAKGEQVVLSEQVGTSDSFPLVKIWFDRLRRNERENVDRNGASKTYGELSRFTGARNNDLGLSPYNDSDKVKPVSLDERYKFTKEEIEPDCGGVQEKWRKAQEKKFSEIDAKYRTIIAQEVAAFAQEEQQRLLASKEEEIKKYWATGVEKDLDIETKNPRSWIAEEYRRRNKKDKDGKTTEKFSMESIAFERKAQLYKEKEIEQINKAKQLLDEARSKKQRDLEQKYSPRITAEKQNVEELCKSDMESEIAQKIEDETVIHYCAFFRIDDGDAKGIGREIEKSKPKYLVLDTNAEKVKIERQGKALNAFFKGYVKNPFLLNYLFAPKSLKSSKRISTADINWVLPDPLNEKQKEAVRKALASESIFLLQGPPGTGKTQVIAELVAQYTKQGKKVLISSETHKAIDNVFERLPKDPNIRPLRLIPSKSNKKDTEYSPDKLLPNFYLNITSKLEQEIRKFENFNQTKENFAKEFELLKTENESLNNNARIFSIAEKLIRKLEQERVAFQEEYDIVKSAIDSKQAEDDERIEKLLMQGMDLSQIETGHDAASQKWLAELEQAISSKNSEIDKLAGGETFAKMQDDKAQLTHKVEKFLRDFDIKTTYKSLDEAILIIAKEWEILNKDYARKDKENKEKIPMFEEICRHLRSQSILESDTEKYTKELFDNANVFGITATSSDRYSEKNNEGLAKCGLGNINLREVGIDVVIVDEVSKSSFIDLLIPILYGKTVILVGDHRQLPPMYDLRHLKDTDVVGLDPEKITVKKNEEYTEMYETCFFKTLYESIASDYKVMLTKQYRCHEDIMRVFNHFYGSEDGQGLELGMENQNAKKQHNVDLRIDGKAVFEKNKHIYFVNCNEHDEGEEGSTSRHNKQEANVVVKLLSELDKVCDGLNQRFSYRIDKERGIDERLSVGVICTYGEQAGKIKRSGILSRCPNFNKKSDDKLVISTVDDFQGDERDIIILSMVRNPRKRGGNYDFVKKYQRINVAMSRARKMLIVVGNRNFLAEAGMIDLPDIDGKKIKKGYPAYRKIIATIAEYGKIIEAEQIIGEKSSRGGNN